MTPEVNHRTLVGADLVARYQLQLEALRAEVLPLQVRVDTRRASAQEESELRMKLAEIRKKESDLRLVGGLRIPAAEVTKAAKAIKTFTPAAASTSLVDLAAAASSAGGASHPAAQLAVHGFARVLDQCDRPVDWHRVKHDFAYFCESFIEILYRPGMYDLEKLAQLKGAEFAERVRRGEVKKGPFILSSHQRQEIAVFIDALFVQKIPLRAAVLKSRQLGNTVTLLAFALWLQTYHAPFHVLLIIDVAAHAHTKRILYLEWLNRLHERWPELKMELRTGGESNKIQTLVNGSMFVFDSSESTNPGTSDQFHMVILSEKPKWKAGRADLVGRSVEPTVAKAPMTAVIDESTANGDSDPFARKWRRITKAGSTSDVIPIFLAWFFSNEYQTEPPTECYDSTGKFVYLELDEFKDFDPANPELEISEKECALRYHLSPWQTYWRRVQIRDSFQGNRAAFDMEYPATPAHAFRASGAQYFASKFVEALQQREDGVQVYRVLDQNGYNNITKPCHYTRLAPGLAPIRGTADAAQGVLLVREFPRPGTEYFAGTDVAEGITIISEKGESDPDYTVLPICDRFGKQVAMYICRLKPDEAWLPLTLVCLFYNHALWSGELNGPGATLLSYLDKLVAYPNLWWDVKESSDLPVAERYWTKLDKGNRPKVLSCLRKAWANRPDRPMTWEQELFVETCQGQVSTFVQHPKTGKPQAAPGCHDDIVLASAHMEWSRQRWLGEDEESEPADVITLPDPYAPPLNASELHLAYHLDVREILGVEDRKSISFEFGGADDPRREEPRTGWRDQSSGWW